MYLYVRHNWVISNIWSHFKLSLKFGNLVVHITYKNNWEGNLRLIVLNHKFDKAKQLQLNIYFEARW